MSAFSLSSLKITVNCSVFICMNMSCRNDVKTNIYDCLIFFLIFYLFFSRYFSGEKTYKISIWCAKLYQYKTSM